MSRTIVLASTHHDPEGLLNQQTRRMLPMLTELYQHMHVVITTATPPATRELLHNAGIQVYDRGTELPETVQYLGHWRRVAIERALQDTPEDGYIHFCDFDRILHWAEYWPDELRTTLDALTAYDFTVLGRTQRAFDSHPRVQRDTETVVNHVFAAASGLDWDVTAAARGFSRRAAEALVTGCSDDTIGNDCSWPLFLQAHGGLSLNHIQTEGLEFETLDRYTEEELRTLGGADAWVARLDGDPRNWSLRLDIARIEVDSIVAYRQHP
jgi:hypothetical protein